mmetsp:Transcript_22987/g.50114  ORF Transcript_22987/g.50114 Transcript_22987/m.50114 type:complete len:285 (+) Transcript_22987:469-1323(+)
MQAPVFRQVVEEILRNLRLHALRRGHFRQDILHARWPLPGIDGNRTNRRHRATRGRRRRGLALRFVVGRSGAQPYRLGRQRPWMLLSFWRRRRRGIPQEARHGFGGSSASGSRRRLRILCRPKIGHDLFGPQLLWRIRKLRRYLDRRSRYELPFPVAQTKHNEPAIAKPKTQRGIVETAHPLSKTSEKISRGQERNDSDQGFWKAVGGGVSQKNGRTRKETVQRYGRRVQILRTFPEVDAYVINDCRNHFGCRWRLRYQNDIGRGGNRGVANSSIHRKIPHSSN